MFDRHEIEGLKESTLRLKQMHKCASTSAHVLLYKQPCHHSERRRKYHINVFHVSNSCRCCAEWLCWRDWCRWHDGRCWRCCETGNRGGRRQHL